MKEKYRKLKGLRDEFHNQLRVWVSTRKRTRELLIKKREALAHSSGLSSWAVLGGLGAAVVFGPTAVVAGTAAAVGVAAAASVGAAAADTARNIQTELARAPARAASGADAPGDGAGVGAGVYSGDEEVILERWQSQRSVDFRQAMDEDKNACQVLQRNQNILGNCVADFAVFCRDHIDSVLSSKLWEGEFRFLPYVLLGTHSPGAAANAQVPILLDEEVNIHVTRVSTLMEKLRRSAANGQVLAITDILHELREGPNDEEIWTMTMNFIEAKFAEACKS